MKTFYLWDLAGTLFPEKWNAEKSGMADIYAYIESLGLDRQTIDPRTFEECYKIPYMKGLVDVSLAKSFEEVLRWTKYNGVFTTGVPAQVDWRAVQLKRKYNFDPRPFFVEILSTFDYANTNEKTDAMLADIINKKAAEGFDAIVYTDDKLTNCRFFLESYAKARNEVAPMQARAYHITQTEQDIVQQGENFWQVGNLLQLQDNEQSIL